MGRGECLKAQHAVALARGGRYVEGAIVGEGAVDPVDLPLGHGEAAVVGQVAVHHSGEVAVGAGGAADVDDHGGRCVSITAGSVIGRHHAGGGGDVGADAAVDVEGCVRARGRRHVDVIAGHQQVTADTAQVGVVVDGDGAGGGISEGDARRAAGEAGGRDAGRALIGSGDQAQAVGGGDGGAAADDDAVGIGDPQGTTVQVIVEGTINGRWIAGGVDVQHINRRFPAGGGNLRRVREGCDGLGSDVEAALTRARVQRGAPAGSVPGDDRGGAGTHGTTDVDRQAGACGVQARHLGRVVDDGAGVGDHVDARGRGNNLAVGRQIRGCCRDRGGGAQCEQRCGEQGFFGELDRHCVGSYGIHGDVTCCQAGVLQHNTLR